MRRIGSGLAAGLWAQPRHAAAQPSSARDRVAGRSGHERAMLGCPLPAAASSYVPETQQRADCEAYAYALWRWSQLLHHQHRRLAYTPSRHLSVPESRQSESDEELLTSFFRDHYLLLLALGFFSMAHTILGDEQQSYLDHQTLSLRLIPSLTEWHRAHERAKKVRSRLHDRGTEESTDPLKPGAASSVRVSTKGR